MAGLVAGGGIKGVRKKPSAPRVGEYTTKLRWGIQDVDVRPGPHGSYWVKRTPQSNPRVDAFELKINPNNESFFLPHTEGGFVQFENLVGVAVQDGKLIMKPRSIYHVMDLPPFARLQVLKEAQRQISAAKKAGLKIEWLVSDDKAISQIRALFDVEEVAITVLYFAE